MHWEFVQEITTDNCFGVFVTMITDTNRSDVMFVSGNGRQLLDDESTALSHNDIKHGP